MCIGSHGPRLDPGGEELEAERETLRIATRVEQERDRPKVWRRAGLDLASLPLSEDDPRNPRFDIRYKDVPDKELPRTESLKDTVERILPYWKEVIFPTLRTADQILVAAHGNSLRGIIKYLKNISDEEIVHLNLPTAVPYVFEFDDDLKLVNDYFLGDPEEIKKLMEAVANQGKKK